MGDMFHAFTDGLGHARNAQAMRDGQERFETAPTYAGDDDTISLDTATDAVIQQIGRACRTFDKATAIDLLKSAASMLDQVCEDIESGEVVL